MTASIHHLPAPSINAASMLAMLDALVISAPGWSGKRVRWPGNEGRCIGRSRNSGLLVMRRDDGTYALAADEEVRHG